MIACIRFVALFALIAGVGWASACDSSGRQSTGAAGASPGHANAVIRPADDGRSDSGAAGESAHALTDSGSSMNIAPTACPSTAARSGDVLVYDLDTGRLIAGADLPTPPTLEGTVVALGTGALPADLTATLATAPPDRSTQRWLRIASADHGAWLVLIYDVPLGFGVLEGSVVTAQYSRAYGDFAVSRTSLTLRVGDALAFHFAFGSSANDLVLPDDVSVVQGAQLCKTHDACGDWRAFAVSVQVQGKRAILETNQQAQVGPFDVWHARTVAQSTANSACPDWNVADSTVALARHVPLQATRQQLCKQKSDAFDAFVETHDECAKDTDCTVIGDCGPNADFRAVRVDGSQQALRLMHDRCVGAFDGPGFLARCQGGKCTLEQDPNRCCGCPRP